MRKNSPRKWLHAVLDLLPVILIPVFMIYSHRHDPAIASTYTEEIPVYYESNEVSSFDDLVVGNIYELNYNNATQTLQDNITLCEKFIVVEGSYVGAGYQGNAQASMPYIQFSSNTYLYTYESIDNVTYTRYWSYVKLYFVFKQTNNNNFPINLVSQTDFQLIKEYQQVTHDFDKDIMGAFMSNFNFTIDKYFNMGNVFNLTGVYDWFNTNIFNGNAPQVIYSVWNIALYELVMDLLFLLYGLFMWFIDMVEHIMNKPFKSVK